jgi:H+/gluconate symporter-like permease
MEVLGIVISLFCLMFFAYRGYSVILFAPVFALAAAALQGLPIMPSYTELFMVKAVSYIKLFFPIFMLGAVLGKVMEETGMARSIAHAIIARLGKERAVLSVVLAAAVLTYGGVSLFVVVFAVYPFAAALFKEANYPKRLVPATVMLGSFSFTMDALPGSPQIQNLIPTSFFGTTTYAAPIMGIVGSIFIFVFGILYLNYRVKSAVNSGEGYGDHKLNEPEIQDNTNLPHWAISCIPLLVVLSLNFIFSRVFVWNPNLLTPFVDLKLPLMVPSINKVIAIWSLIIALVVGITVAVGLSYTRLPKKGSLAKLKIALNAGTIGSLLAIMNTASEVGYGNVIAALPGFKSISAALMNIHVGSSPLVSEAVTVTTLAGITGSASGGMSIALDLMSKDWLAWANQIGMSPEVLHRIASMASGGLDTLPHNGAVITLLAVCGLTHLQSYKDMFAITLIRTGVAFLMIPFHLLTGLV